MIFKLKIKEDREGTRIRVEVEIGEGGILVTFA